MISKDYEFFMKTDMSHYLGKWVAICDERIISFGDSAKKVFEDAKKKCPNKKPLLTRIPDKDTMIF